MSASLSRLAALSLTGLAAVLVPRPANPQEDVGPKKLGLTERAERQLEQVEVSLEGPPDRIVGLTLEDFRLFVGGKRIQPVAVDPFCRASAESTEDVHVEELPATAPAARSSFLFYFDQRHLTPAGRLRSLEVAEGMIAQLITGGNRGAIVSSGRRLATFAGFTERKEPLIEALGRLRDDRMQWDDYPALEEYRYEDILRSSGGRRSGAGCLQARVYQREELARAESALDLFSTVLGRYAELDPPKVAIYFADTLRDDPGRHYFELVRGCEESSFDARFAFRRVHEAAAALGVKLYAVQAEGLVAPDVTRAREARDAAVRDAQSGLKNLALDTGGDAFLNGLTAERIVHRIEADASCVYLLSFDPAGVPQDKLLAVQVEVDRRGVRARTRTHLVIQSESVRRIAKLLAAFVAPENLRDALTLHGGIVPLEEDDGRLRVLVQASTPETHLGVAEEWDLGMSLVSGTGVRDQASGRIAADRPGARFVLEAEMALRPGPFEIALVAIESLSGTVAAGRVVGTWPEKEGAPRIAPIALLQPVEGAFLRDGQVRSGGSLVIGEDQPVRADLPTAFVTLVCRGGKGPAPLRVDRVLTGETPANFSPIEIPAGESPCAQVRDLIPADTLSAGSFTYSVSVEGAQKLESREFVVE